MKQTKVSRRNFLMAATVGTAATAAALVRNKDTASGSDQASSMDPGKGYQLTDHVRNYYRTAKV